MAVGLLHNLKMWMTIVLLLVIIPLVLYFFHQFQYMQKYSKSVRDICIEKATIDCRSFSLGSWQKDCYYDAGRFDAPHKYDDSMKQQCFAFHDFSDQPKNCYNDFELKSGSGFETVICEDFYQAIENKNKSCGNCLKTVKASNKF